MNTLRNLILFSFAALILSGCAAGAATAGYAIKAQSADGLSAAAEQRIIDRAKREITFENFSTNNQDVSS